MSGRAYDSGGLLSPPSPSHSARDDASPDASAQRASSSAPYAAQRDLIVVSNRLPFVVERDAQTGGWQVRAGSGGLITAMAPVLRSRGGTWLGWPGAPAEERLNVQAALAGRCDRWGYHVVPVHLRREEVAGFYEGFANQIIWPLFHSLDERCNFLPQFWQTYQVVNARFAHAIATTLGRQKPFIWVHDYHLMLTGEQLRKRGATARIGFFLHTPFPPPSIFLKLPWRLHILNGLLAYDLIGFQTAGDRRNFVQCVRTLLPHHLITGRGRVKRVLAGRRSVALGVFPISIDYDEFARTAAGEDVSRICHRLAADHQERRLILGVDRLDYTKGIPARLKAFRNALLRFPELRHRVTYVQVVVPSRENIEAYRALKEEIEELVGEINGEYTQSGWVPVHYIFRALSRQELVALYRSAAICLVTPLNDGMNLVAKEYCACNLSETGVLVLSEFAGAADELHRGAILVNPYDHEGVAEAIHDALLMPREQRRGRMQSLRRHIRRRNVFSWVDAFVAAGLKRPDETPVQPHTGAWDEDPAASGWDEEYESEAAVHSLVDAQRRETHGAQVH